MKVAVLGAGNAGQAFAGDITLSGHRVHLAAVTDYSSKIDILRAADGLTLVGMTANGENGGFVKVDRVDTEVGQAIADAEVVFLVVPAFAHDTYFDLIVRYAESGQMVVIQPGKFGAMRLAQVMRKHGRDPDELLITETNSFLYAAKISGPSRVWLRGVKRSLPLAAFNQARTTEAVERLATIHSQYRAASSVLETSFGDPFVSLHPVTTLLDLSRIEQIGSYPTRSYSITPSVARMVEAVDAERCALADRVGVPTTTLLECLSDAYGSVGDTVFEMVSGTTVYEEQMTPASANHRYVTEEVPYGLVPFAEIGRLVGVPTPAMDSIITLASHVNAVDYRAVGLRLSSLGLGLDSLETLFAHV